MSTDTPDTGPDAGEAIKIALASAETATDAASLAEKTSRKLSTKADWVDKKLIPFGVGGLIGVTVCATLSGLVYFRTLSDLRTARDTHVEALHLFTQNVNKLNAAVTLSQEMIDNQATERAELATALTEVTASITQFETQLTVSSETISMALGDGAQGFASQLAMLMDPRVDAIRDDILVGLSDLQVAMSQKLSTVANQVKVSSAAAPMAKPTAAPSSGGTFTSQAKPKPKPAPTRTVSNTRKSAPTPPKNPFSYP